MKATIVFSSLLLGLVASACAQADCNHPATDYERRDCASQADRDFRRGNSDADRAKDSYLQNLRRNAEEEEENRRQAKQQREAEEWRKMQERDLQEREQQALKQAREFEKQYGTRSVREAAYTEAGETFRAAQQFEQEGHDDLAERLYRRAEEHMAVAAIDHPKDYALVIEALGESLRRQGRYEEAVPLLNKALGQRKFLTNDSHPSLGDALISLGRTYTALGRYGEAESSLLKALSIREEQYGKTSTDAAYCHNYLGSMYARQKRYDEAESHYKATISIRTERQGEEHANTLSAMKQLTTLYRDAGMNNKADKLDNKIRQVSKNPQFTSSASAPPQPVADWRIEWNKLSDEAASMSADRKIKPALAIEKARQALALAEKNDEPKRFNVASSQDLLAKILWRDRQTDEAEALFKSALKTYEQSSEGKIQAVVATVSISLAKLHEFQKRGAEAEPLYKRALAIREKRIDQDLPAVIDTLVDLEDYYERKKRHAEREPLLRRIVDLQEKNLGRENVAFAEVIINLAKYLVLPENPRYGEAEALYKRALVILEKKPDEDRSLLLLSLMSLRELYVKTGRDEEAEKVRLRETAYLATK